MTYLYVSDRVVQYHVYICEQLVGAVKIADDETFIIFYAFGLCVSRIRICNMRTKERHRNRTLAYPVCVYLIWKSKLNSTRIEVMLTECSSFSHFGRLTRRWLFRAIYNKNWLYWAFTPIIHQIFALIQSKYKQFLEKTS